MPDDLTDEELGKVSPHLTPDVRGVLNVQGALASRKAYGGTAPDRVREQLGTLRTLVNEHAAWATGSDA
jgi:argininosuccinate lyase